MFFSRKKKEYILTPTQELFLALLRAQLWLKPVDDISLPSSMEEWDDLLNLGYKQTVICFIAAACLRHKDVDGIPLDIKEELEIVIEENKKIHEYHNRAIVEVFSLLEENGLYPILLKGQGLAQLYPQPELRQCGDVDIFIGPKDYEKACRIMDDYCGPEAKQNAFYEDQLHYHISNGSVTFEIHRKAADAAKIYRDSQFNAWAYEWLVAEKCYKITINDKTIFIPNAQYNTLYVFDHLIKHIRCEGVNLRQFCDWMMLLNSYKDAIDVRGLTYNLKVYSSLKAWQILGGVLVNQLGQRAEEFPLWNQLKGEKSQGDVLNEIINGCSFCNGSKYNDRHTKQNRGIKRTLDAICLDFRVSRFMAVISERVAAENFFENIWNRVKVNCLGYMDYYR